MGGLFSKLIENSLLNGVYIRAARLYKNKLAVQSQLHSCLMPSEITLLKVPIYSHPHTPILLPSSFQVFSSMDHSLSSLSSILLFLVSNSGNSSRQIYSKKSPSPPSAHIQRKKRTLNIILILIIVFAVCRLPLWIFLLVKLHVRLEGNFWWYLQTFFSTLSYLNATIDPFLYAFLNETLSLVTSICSWRKGNLEATSIMDTNENHANENVTEKDAVKIPRGPYLHQDEN